MERPPRVGAAVLAKALAGVFIVFVATTARGRAAPATCRSKPPEPPEGAPPRAAADPGRSRRQALPTSSPAARGRCWCSAPTGARRHSTDAKLCGQADQPHSDTIVLVRLDPKRNRIAVLSLPRDLAVTIPGYADSMKINQAYDEGGAGARRSTTVKLLFSNATGTRLDGQQRHRRQLQRLPARGQLHRRRLRRRRPPTTTTPRARASRRSTSSPATSGSSAPTRSPTSAIATRTRDLFRNARQQDFLRQAVAPAGGATSSRASARPQNFLGTMRSYFRFDKKFLSRAQPRRADQDRGLPGAPPRAGQPDLAPRGSPSPTTRRRHPPVLSNESLQKAYDAVHDRRGLEQPRASAKSRTAKKAKKPAKASRRHVRPGERRVASARTWRCSPRHG